MKKKSIVKMIIDLMMTILLPFLMIQALGGEELHEWIGVMMFLLFMMHHILNFNWHKNLLKGKYNAVTVCVCLFAVTGYVVSDRLKKLSMST